VGALSPLATTLSTNPAGSVAARVLMQDNNEITPAINPTTQKRRPKLL